MNLTKIEEFFYATGEHATSDFRSLLDYQLKKATGLEITVEKDENPEITQSKTFDTPQEKRSGE